MDLTKKLVGYPMKELVPVITDLIDQGKSVILTARGSSMRPMVKDMRDSVILSAYNGGAKVGDVVLYKRENGAFVLHRIVDKKADGSYVFMGDFQTIREEGIREDQIIALLSGIVRKNKTILCSSGKYQRYARFWTKSKFVRGLYVKSVTFGVWIKAVLKKLFHR